MQARVRAVVNLALKLTRPATTCSRHPAEAAEGGPLYLKLPNHPTCSTKQISLTDERESATVDFSALLAGRWQMLTLTLTQENPNVSVTPACGSWQMLWGRFKHQAPTGRPGCCRRPCAALMLVLCHVLPLCRVLPLCCPPVAQPMQQPCWSHALWLPAAARHLLVQLALTHNATSNRAHRPAASCCTTAAGRLHWLP